LSSFVKFFLDIPLAVLSNFKKLAGKNLRFDENAYCQVFEPYPTGRLIAFNNIPPTHDVDGRDDPRNKHGDGHYDATGVPAAPASLTS
jgi:hypothetical protein